MVSNSTGNGTVRISFHDHSGSGNLKMANQKIRLATSSPGTQGTLKETLAHLHQIARRAAAEKADILLLPEAYLGGYPRGTYFGCKIGSRTAEGRDEYLQYFKNAVDLGDTVGGGAGAGDAWVKRQLGGNSVEGKTSKEGPPQRGDGTREELERISRETGVFVVTGLIEKAGGSLYCSAVYVCPKLGIIGKRRKTQPTGTERLVWAQGSPATLKAVSTTIKGVRINLAAAICWENYMPLLRQTLYQQNINLYLAPTADGRDAWLSTMRTIGLEGRCFVVSSNMCVRSSGATTRKQPEPREPTGAANASAYSKGVGAQAAGEQVNGIPESHPRGGGRRNSCFTEEGFEIALPGTVGEGHEEEEEEAAFSRSRGQRRRSVFDGDGNEIVLCGQDTGAVIEEEKEEEEEEATEEAPASKTTTTAGGKAADEFVSRGGSCIVSPFGDVVAGPQWEDEEGIIYADVDFEDCVRGRLDIDVAGSYSRNDSFRFEVEGLDMDPLPYY
ncbi:carbon-nitrogen hydrolase [Truncatella angustata]|uniref:Carbon-nitrogen hydrolase n=1 Tax=Truncatella angustata TaxID=152316 RepID=A0A9P8UCP3_9PEZI|nr:carbon-nitrogen hydrolase [Truncatella angustata]KAH6646072.1 carbon-nitrogen hydrolase [Truncatella angustata]